MAEIKIRYFAWVREKVGRAEETLALPEHVATVGELVEFLKSRGPEFEDAFRKPGVVRAALDQTHVKLTHPLSGAREVGFFPPVTGG